MDLKQSAKGLNTPAFSLMQIMIALPIVTGAMLLPGHSAIAQGTPPGDISGVWWITEYNPSLQIEGGGEIPYNEEGSALHERNVAGLANGTIEDEPRTICTPDGVPRILGNPYPFKIVHTPEQTTILYELNDVFRIVLMDSPQLSEFDLMVLPYYSGHSIGHWEGETLVVETAGLKDKSFLDATGAPQSFEMTTVERYRTINGGTQLENVVTITDPIYLTEPVTARYVYDAHPDVRLDTYVCGEPHRDISQVPGVTEARSARNP